MAYTIPVPEHLVHTFLFDQLPPWADVLRVQYAGGGVVVAARLRTMGFSVPLQVIFAPSASSPDETTSALIWQIQSVRPFFIRWLLRAGLIHLGALGRLVRRGEIVAISLDELLNQLPAWKRLPVSLRRSLRLQHWWMPSDGRGVFLVFGKDSDALAPTPWRLGRPPVHAGRHRSPRSP